MEEGGHLEKGHRACLLFSLLLGQCYVGQLNPKRKLQGFIQPELLGSRRGGVGGGDNQDQELENATLNSVLVFRDLDRIQKILNSEIWAEYS